MTTLMAILCALVALYAQPGPTEFTANLSPLTAHVVQQGDFIGIEWPCYRGDDERCYAGIGGGEISVGP